MRKSNLSDYTKISFNIPTELYSRYDKCIPHGSKERVMSRVMQLLVDKIEIGGYLVIGAIMAGDFDPLFTREETKDGKAT